MPVRTPHFPDLLFGSAARLRRWEAALMGLLAAQGYRELHPSLVLREAIPDGALRFFDGDESSWPCAGISRWPWRACWPAVRGATGPGGLRGGRVPPAHPALGGGRALRGGL
ncbi:MAG: hypothetical protein IPO28_09780 [Holophagaceae bacterium]|nr:hypothetical protein [Holophagaceae bacterium]